jgi:acyl-CoA thioesterase
VTRPAAEAAATVARLAGRDRLAALFGVRHVDGGPGRAVLRMTVTADHLNFLGGGHGGMVFAFADMAFGLASNSHGVTAVGIDAHVAFANGVAEGDVLTAAAEEVARSRKVATYRVPVTRDDGTLVATFTGTVYVTGKPLPE